MPHRLPSAPPLPARLRTEHVHIDAPFGMPSITVPDFSLAPRRSITEFGAVQNDTPATTQAIARAIAAANADGGGRVVVPEGTWTTGAVHLKSRVNLHLSRGAVLVFSADPLDYLPAVPTSWEGIECYNYSPLIYAYDCENIAITGEGKLQANLDIWQRWYPRPQPHLDALVALYDMGRNHVPVEQRNMAVGVNNLRPHFLHFNRCRHVLLEDITILHSPFWVVHPYLCRDVVIRRIKVRAHGHNNDGVDPEMSQNLLIEDCVFDQGDDAISVKSGRDFDAWRLHTPAKNIVMRRCLVKNGHHLVAIGSELSGGVENVFIDRCRFEPSPSGSPGAANTARFLRGDDLATAADSNILYIKTNERRGGYVKNIYLTHITATRIGGGVLSIETDVLYQWRTLSPTYKRVLTPIEGIRLDDINVGSAKFICFIKAEADMPVKDIRLTRIRMGSVRGEPITAVNAQNLSIVTKGDSGQSGRV